MNRANPSSFATNAGETTAAEELAAAKPVFEALQVELERLVRARTSFRADLREAVAEGDRMIEAVVHA